MMRHTAELARGPAEELEAWLPVSHCLIRVSRRGSGDRRALEVFAGGELIGVTVAGVFGAGAFGDGVTGGTARGRHAGPRGQAWALAWGRVTDGQVPPVLAFGPPGLRVPARASWPPAHRAQYVEPAVIAGTFWVGEAAGRFRSVAVGGRLVLRPHRITALT
jgi:hypothetical protein